MKYARWKFRPGYIKCGYSYRSELNKGNFGRSTNCLRELEIRCLGKFPRQDLLISAYPDVQFGALGIGLSHKLHGL